MDLNQDLLPFAVHVMVKRIIIETIGGSSLATLNFSLHETQLEVFNDRHRFKILCAGRRWGKSRLASYIVIIKALSKQDLVIWLVSPRYSQTLIIWRMLKKFLPKDYIKDIKEGTLSIELINGSTIWAKSGDDPNALVGEGLDFLVLDEAARVKPEVWETSLQPALMDKKGGALFISTPVSKNWFYLLYIRGTQDDKEYKSFHYTSYENPILDPEELDTRKTSMPELIYRQEILAEFVEGGGEDGTIKIEVVRYTDKE